MSRRRRRGRESYAGRLAQSPHSMRVVEACSAAAARGAAFVRPHCRPHIMRRIRAELVCRIKWIRRHDTFSSYRLRRKLHGPFNYAAGNAASYALVPFRQDRAWLCRTEDYHGQSKEIQEEDLRRLQCHNVCTVCHFILHHWAHLSGTQQPCTRLP